MSRRFASGVVVALLSACGGGGPRHVELSGKTPAEGSAQAADAVCDQIARCGTVAVVCVGDGSGVIDCTAHITTPDYTICVANAQGDFQELLSCPALTAAQVDMIEACVDARASRACLTQAEADVFAAAAEANGGDANLDPPPECAFLTAGLPGCG